MPALNTFLRTSARQNQRDNIGRTFVAVEADSAVVCGFYMLTVGSVSRDVLPSAEASGLPRYPVPVAHLGRLGVAKVAQGQRLGEELLLHALEQVMRISEVVGVYAVEARAKAEGARSFYARYGFKPLLDDALHLYLPTRALAGLFD
ncbi:MAG: GNAT family N-acetyltransferase [Myxococcaceae bacterium]|nr:GNAT family N-acetyltransferase [Myxococcaceae bacterium]